MAIKSKVAFGESDRIESSKEQGIIDAGDILFLDSETDAPKLGWITPQGKTVILTDEKADLTEVKAEIAEVDAEVEAIGNKVSEVEDTIATKADAETVKQSYEKIKFEISDVPVGTLVDMDREKEIRIMVPNGTVFTKQNVGAGGDADTYYITLRTLAPEGANGYIEHLNGQHDANVLTDLKVDQYGRKYQPTWLGVAKYDASSDSWTYYGASSSTEKYIGWDYQIDWYKDGVMIACDSTRINLSNEECHGDIKPSYISAVLKEMKTYCDEVAANASISVVEF